MKKILALLPVLFLVVGCGSDRQMEFNEEAENEFEKIVFNDYFFCETYDGVEEEPVESDGFAEFVLAMYGMEEEKLERIDGHKWLIVSGKYTCKTDKKVGFFEVAAFADFNNSKPIKGKIYGKSPHGILDFGLNKLEKEMDVDFVATFSVPEKILKKWKRCKVRFGFDSDEAKMVTLPPEKLERCYTINLEN